MSAYNEKSKIYPSGRRESLQRPIEMEERMKIVADTAIREIRKVVRMPGKGIDEQGMAEAVQGIKKDLRKNSMLNWDSVFEYINSKVQREIEQLRLQGSGQDIVEKITRTREAWKYLAKDVLGREYVPY